MMAVSSYVYTIGKVIPRFPNRSIELELVKPQEDNHRRNERPCYEEVLYRTLTDPNNRYIARQVCYVLTIEGLETYILVPLILWISTGSLKPSNPFLVNLRTLI